MWADLPEGKKPPKRLSKWEDKGLKITFEKEGVAVYCVVVLGWWSDTITGHIKEEWLVTPLATVCLGEAW